MPRNGSFCTTDRVSFFSPISLLSFFLRSRIFNSLDSQRPFTRLPRGFIWSGDYIWPVTRSTGCRHCTYIEKICTSKSLPPNHDILKQKSWNNGIVNTPAIFAIVNILLCLFHDISTIYPSIYLFYFYPFQSCRCGYTLALNLSCFICFQHSPEVVMVISVFQRVSRGPEVQATH